MHCLLKQKEFTMEAYKEYTIDYIEGRVTPQDFLQALEKKPELCAWIDSIVPAGKTTGVIERLKTEPYFTRYDVPFTIRVYVKSCEDISLGGPKGSAGYHLNIHSTITQLVQNAFPELDLKPDTAPRDKFRFLLDACPEYVDGTEITQHMILEHILEEIPPELSKTKRIKLFRERLREVFHLEGRKYPHWIQSPEWPVNNGKPMRYLKTISVNPEFRKHVFVDVDTGETREVDDFF